MRRKVLVLAVALAASLVLNAFLMWQASAAPSAGPAIVLKANKAKRIEKEGVKMRIYGTPANYSQAAIVYQETDAGHFQEFYNIKSHHIYYILEGRGTWFIEGKPFPVVAGDVVIIPPHLKFYYTGKLKQICVTSPAWRPQHERIVRSMPRPGR